MEDDVIEQLSFDDAVKSIFGTGMISSAAKCAPGGRIRVHETRRRRWWQFWLPRERAVTTEYACCCAEHDNPDDLGKVLPTTNVDVPMPKVMPPKVA